MGVIVVLGTGGRYVSGVTLLEEPLVAARPCFVLPWGCAGASRQGGPVLEHAEQRGALRLAEEAPHGCHPPSGLKQGRRLSWEKIPETLGLHAGSGLGEMGEWPEPAPVTPTLRNALVVPAGPPRGLRPRSLSVTGAERLLRPPGDHSVPALRTYIPLPTPLPLPLSRPPAGPQAAPLAFDLPVYLNYWRLGGFCPEV